MRTGTCVKRIYHDGSDFYEQHATGNRGEPRPIAFFVCSDRYSEIISYNNKMYEVEAHWIKIKSQKSKKKN